MHGSRVVVMNTETPRPYQVSARVPQLLRIRPLPPVRDPGALLRDWYFIAQQPAPSPRLARPEGRAALTHIC